MKTKIAVTGQLNSKFTLRNYISRYHFGKESQIFNIHIFHFETKKEAMQAMRKAKKEIKNDHLKIEFFNRGVLLYDAGKAEIFRDEQN